MGVALTPLARRAPAAISHETELALQMDNGFDAAYRGFLEAYPGYSSTSPAG